MSSDVASIVALGSLALYGSFTLLGRSLVQRRQTGSTGWRGISGRPGSLAWWAGISMVLACIGLVLAPVIGMLMPAEPVSWIRLGLGAGAWLVGTIVTIVAQLQMGDSWRIGVQEGERTELRTDGLFRWCRNPIFTGMLLTSGSMVLWVPMAALAWVMLWLGLSLQVRHVEEPHLLQVHGAAYRAYALRTGRFWPYVGRGTR